jgi:hypothetical protein
MRGSTRDGAAADGDGLPERCEQFNAPPTDAQKPSVCPTACIQASAGPRGQLREIVTLAIMKAVLRMTEMGHLWRVSRSDRSGAPVVREAEMARPARAAWRAAGGIAAPQSRVRPRSVLIPQRRLSWETLRSGSSGRLYWRVGGSGGPVAARDSGGAVLVVGARTRPLSGS